MRLLLLSLLAAFSIDAAPTPPVQPRQPNIVLILVDDMGWGDLGVTHQNARDKKKLPAIETPHFDRFAAEGTQLLRHYSACPVCAPARASLFSGVHQGHAETIRNNNFDAALENSHTLASVLKAAGYSTALIGKWGIGGGKEQGGTPETAAAWPTKRGFDYFFGYHNHIAGHRHYPKETAAADPDTGHNAIWSSDEHKTEEISQDCDFCYSTDLFTARAKKWIVDQRKRNPKKPFFVALTFTAPHARLAVPCGPYPKGGGLRGGVQWLGKPGKMINTAACDWDSFIYPAYKNKDWPLFAKRHATMITRVDDAVGDLVHLMKDLKIDDKTMIVFLSDNGPHNEAGAVGGKPGHPAPAQDPSFFQSYGPMDGIKRDCWEGGLRVPALVRFPGTVKPGQKTLSPSQFHDWMATFADLAGIARPMRSDGVSLMPLLQGNPDAQPESTIYSEYAIGGTTPGYGDFTSGHKGRKRGQMQVVYVDGLKGVRYDMKDVRDPFEIYDTAKDPGERVNLAAKRPELQEKMQKEALYNRRAFDYVWNRAYKRNNPITGKRPYDKTLVPPVEQKNARPGATVRRVMATSPWVPAFDTLPGAAKAVSRKITDPAGVKLPAGSITEFQGYIDVPQDGNYTFSLQLDRVTGSKAYAKMHAFQLVDADFNYIPGTEASSSSAINADEADPGQNGKQPIPLAAGLHPVTITVVQGPGSAGHMRLFWQRAGEKDKTPVPASAWKTAQHTN